MIKHAAREVVRDNGSFSLFPPGQEDPPDIRRTRGVQGAEHCGHDFLSHEVHAG